MKKDKKDSSMTKILKYAKPHKYMFIASVTMAILGVVLGLIPYLAASKIIVELLDGNKVKSFYLGWCAMALIGHLCKVVLLAFSTSISHKATFETLKEVRHMLIGKLTRMPMGEIINTSSGTFKNIIVDRVESMEITLAHLLPEFTSNLIGPLLIIIALFVIDFRMALLTLVTVPVGMLFMASVMKTYPQKYAGSVKINKKMNHTIIEYVNGIEVIKTFNQSDKSYGKYENAVTENASYFYQWMKSCQLPMAAFKAICPAVLITVLPIGYLFYLGGSLNSGEFITIIILAFSIVEPILAASNFTDSLATVGTILNEIEFVENAEELNRPKENVKLDNLAIELKHITFKYKKDDKEDVLKDVNLSIEPGTVTALVGPSGSGKSTITKLIAGFWDVKEGCITLGGKNLKQIPQSQLAGCIAYVSQDNYLFDISVRDNIRVGKPSATDAEVEKVAKEAGCDEFIRKLQNGYDTMTGGAGAHLSGGERQRISIARAMLKNAPIVILDEATAYIDPENEAIIQKAVGKLVIGKTLIVIAHRLSTIIDSEQIVVMKNGKVENTGTHLELLKKSSLYRNMWNAHIGARKGETA